MKNRSKIEAFTLTELLIVIILTSIVVGLAFSVLTLVKRHMNAVNQNFTITTEKGKLEQSLWLDFNRFNTLSYDNIENTLVFKNVIDSTKYTFYDDFIVKKNDTFKLKISDQKFFYKGEYANENQIDAIKLNLSKKLADQVIFIYKQNDAVLDLN